MLEAILHDITINNIIHYITTSYVDTIRCHTAVGRYPCLSISCKPIVRHGYRSTAVWQRIDLCKKLFLFNAMMVI